MINMYVKNNFIRKLSTLCLMILIAMTAYSQVTVTGTVKSGSDDMPLPGVNVVVKGSSMGTITDIDGNYTLEVPGPESTLVFSMVGMLKEEVPVGDKTSIDITMTEDLIGLDEVVVVGYGTMKKSDLTGAIVSMDQNQMTETKTNNVLESLQGKAAGVDIQRNDGRAGSGVDITIRGNRSLTANNGPLIIVDGIPYGNDIDIDPNDIESIEILKDVSSTAIYGSRGANGVILITTKKGTKGKTRVYFNTYHGITQPYQKIPVFDREGYIQAKIDANRDIYLWDTMPNLTNVFPGDELTGYENGTETDWQDVITRNGIRSNYHVGFAGGTDKFAYNTSINYYKEKGVVLADEFERITYRLNLEGNINDYIKIGGSSILSYKKQEGRGPRFTDAVRLSPIVPAYDSANNYIYQPNFANPRKSPLARVQDEEEDRRTRIFQTFYTQIDILENLYFRSNFGVDLNFNRLGYMYPQKVADEGFTESGSNVDFNYSYTWTNLLNYSKDFDEHGINVTLGQEARYTRLEDYMMSGRLQDFDRSLWYNLTTNKDKETGSQLEESSMLSYFSRINYNYAGKYMFNFTGRYDGASQLAEGNKWDFFPSASFAWRVTGEDFMDNVAVISDMKLRLGVGVSGNSSVDPYSTSAALNSYPLYMQFGNPGEEETYFGYRPVNLASKSLAWETTTSSNIGIDLGLFNNRLVANIDMFRANTDNLLLADKLPLSSGFFQIITNAGETQTQGIELNLSSINVDMGDFKWTSSLTFSAIQEEIVSLTSGVQQDLGNGWFVGEPINVIYDYDMEGIWQIGEEDEAAAVGSAPGQIRVRDIHEDDTIDFNDRTIIGQENPKWTGSFVNTFNYKGFDLTINIYARMGHMIDAGAYDFDPRMYDNQIEIPYWTPVNQSNEYPRLDASMAEMDYEQLLSYKDGSFIKMKNITLGYTLPQSVISQVNIAKARIYFSSNNPFILHSNLDKGIDPERGGSITWPLARTMIFGLNLEF